MAESDDRTEELGLRHLRPRDPERAGHGREDRANRSHPSAGLVLRRDPGCDDGRPSQRDRGGRPPRRFDADGDRARPEEGGLRRGRHRRGSRQHRRSTVRQKGIPRRPVVGGGVRVAAADRSGVALLGEQLRGGQVAGRIRRVVLERRHHADGRGAAPRHGDDGTAQLARDARRGQHARHTRWISDN